MKIHILGSFYFLLLSLLALSANADIIDVQVLTSSDDAHHAPGGWPGYSSGKSFIYAGNPSNVVWGGWRFTGFNIPPGSVITSAELELVQHGWGHTVQTTLSFEDSAAPEAFSSSSSPFDRWASSTAFQLPWTASLQSPGAAITTPDLSPGIQELVDKHGGLDTIVILEDGSGLSSGQYHQWKSFDGGAASAAKLHIEYISGVDLTPPLRNDGQPSGTVAEGTTDVTLSLDTDENAACKYSTTADMPYNLMLLTFSATGSTSHSTLITGLTEDTSYIYYVKCIDVEGNFNTDDFLISFIVPPPDVIPPTIVSATATDSSHVEIFFSEPVEQTSATDPANYVINASVNVISASLGIDLQTVTLTTTIFAEGNYLVQAFNIQDLALTPNIQPLSQMTFTFAVAPSTFPGATWETRTPAEVGLNDSKLDELVAMVGGDGSCVLISYPSSLLK